MGTINRKYLEILNNENSKYRSDPLYSVYIFFSLTELFPALYRISFDVYLF